MKALVILLGTACIASAAFGAGYKKNKDAKSKNGFKPKQVNASIFNAGITTPLGGINGTPHLGVEIGFSTPLKANAKKLNLNVGADLGFFNQKDLQNGYYLKPNISYSFPIYKGFYLQPKLGAGFMLSNTLNQEFSRETSGAYSASSNWHPQFLGTFGVQAGLPVYKSKQQTYEAFVRYEFGAQTPFSAISALLPMSLWHLGINVKGE